MRRQDEDGEGEGGAGADHCLELIDQAWKLVWPERQIIVPPRAEYHAVRRPEIESK